MPFAHCPTCNQRFHLNVGDLAAWYRERWPMLPIGAEVPEECPICWGKRTGVEFSWAERVRPYAREEVQKAKDRPPERGAVCSGCKAVIPRFTELSPEVEGRVRHLLAQNEKIKAIHELIAATGCSLGWAHLWISHPNGPELHQKSGMGPPCYYCGKALRSPVAQQCVECGMDWHDARRVFRLGAGARLPTAEEGAPPEVLDGLRVVAWAVIGHGARFTGQTRHLNPQGEILRGRYLVIARDDQSKGWCLFHCDAEWKVKADTWHASLAEAQSQAKFEVEGVEEHWRYRPPPVSLS
jgi:hypothetical protein